MQAACRLHAGCMQPESSLLHKCMQPAATCNLLHMIVFRMHSAWMQAACNLMQLPACSLLQPATSCIRSYSPWCASFLLLTFRRSRRAKRWCRRAGLRSLQVRRRSCTNQSEIIWYSINVAYVGHTSYTCHIRDRLSNNFSHGLYRTMHDIATNAFLVIITDSRTEIH